jgi:hypothetical protein
MTILMNCFLSSTESDYTVVRKDVFSLAWRPSKLAFGTSFNLIHGLDPDELAVCPSET